MITIVLKDSDGNIKSSVTEKEFIGTISYLDAIAREVCALKGNLDYARFYETNLFDFTENSTSLKLWKKASAAYLTNLLKKDCVAQVKDLLSKTATRFSAILPTINSTPTASACDTYTEEESTEISDINTSSAAANIITNNINDILNQFGGMANKIIMKQEYLEGLTGITYWDNMERFINANWEEIYGLIEKFQNTTECSIKYKADADDVKIISQLYTESGLKI